MLTKISSSWAANIISISGTLVVPPACTVDDGEHIDLDFGNRIGGKNKQRNLSHKI